MPAFTELAPGLKRLVAPNPSLMTGPGTNTYLFGEHEVAVLDPGPVIDSHLEQIVEQAQAPIRWVIATHTHPDHSPAAMRLAEMTGADVLGRPPPEGPHQDASFTPGRILDDGMRLLIDGKSIEVIHTPGHASNHVCLRHIELNWLFSGDHVIDGSTVVIDPPDGNMKDYLDSLARLRRLGLDAIAPGHGDLIHDPDRAIDWIIEHRLQRESSVLDALRKNPGCSTIGLVPHVYKDVDKKLYGWAERSLLAHLIKLEGDGVAARENGLWILRS